MVLDVLNAQLAPLGRRIGPDPSHSESRTIGGMVGLDAAGIRSLRYGTTADHVRAALGRLRQRRGRRRRLRALALARRRAGRASRSWSSASSGRSTGATSTSSPGSGPGRSRNRAGYALGDAASPVGVDLARLLVGSEGTLALVTEITLRTVPIPAAQAVVVLPVRPDRRRGRRRWSTASRFGPSACELFDWRSLSLARDVLPAMRPWIAEAAESALVVEFDGDDPAEVLDRLRGLTRRVERLGPAGRPTRSRRPAGPTATSSWASAGRSPRA